MKHAPFIRNVILVFPFMLAGGVFRKKNDGRADEDDTQYTVEPGGLVAALHFVR